jgi:hypothetical protein
MTKTQRIRELMKQGKSGTARQLADAVGLDPDSAHPILGNMIKMGLVEIVDQTWVDTGHKVNVYAPTALIHDDSIASSPNWSQIKQNPNRRKIHAEGLVGLRGVVLAVIADAAKDAKRGQRDAIEWFESPTFEFYMDWLDLNPEMRPAFLESSS